MKTKKKWKKTIRSLRAMCGYPVKHPKVKTKEEFLMHIRMYVACLSDPATSSAVEDLTKEIRAESEDVASNTYSVYLTLKGVGTIEACKLILTELAHVGISSNSKIAKNGLMYHLVVSGITSSPVTWSEVALTDKISHIIWSAASQYVEIDMRMHVIDSPVACGFLFEKDDYDMWSGGQIA